ncbi:hypothetical protein [Vibrio parahaemolyticus]|uniref:hypothetical protein n=1 Tax=Vibrio parahaemolyticus TaxID=670 RepID=UPI00111E7704|nr:hypothetical protein [Vibrio parahaemolyticus]MEA5247559.1 hypothetical protein [Vibrio parahaemolyticus]TOH14942.1 hypothetical protein CGI87_18290 [Vibrio parahaemolyticus]
MAIGIDWICHHNLGMKNFVHDRSAIQKVIRKVEIDLYSKLTSVQKCAVCGGALMLGLAMYTST